MDKHLRTRRLFGWDGKALVLALDRPRALFTPALTDPVLILRLCQSAVDSVIVPLGTLRVAARSFGSMGVLLSVREDEANVADIVSTALRWGAEGVKYEAFPGGPAERATMRMLEELGRACDDAGLPLLAEMIPHSFEAVQHHTPEAVSSAARMAMECGADAIKVPIPVGGGLDAVVDYAAVPVVALGGPATSQADFLGTARTVMASGAAGLAVGRNIFEASDPGEMASQLHEIIHAGSRPTSTPRSP